MTHWPPMHSLFYAAAMMSGLSAGASTKALALLSVVVGGLGWVLLLRTLGAPPVSLFSVAIAYPWLSFLARIYLDYKNDHWACAIAPWIYLAIIQTPTLKQSKSDNVAKIVGTGLLTGIGVTIKYSMMPFLISSILYFVWLDGFDVSQARIKRMLLFSGAVIVPGTVLFILNLALADVAYPVSLGIGPDISLVSLTHFLTNTFAYPVGLDFLLTQLDMALASK